MAPPSFPQGMTLHSIGYAALKYPDVPPELGVPLNNQVGVLQRNGGDRQDHMIAQIGSQYLTALLEYQSSNDSYLHDPSSPQYYFSTAICLLNFLTTNPDVCVRIVKHPGVVHGVIENLLDPNVEAAMRACDRSVGPQFPPATFEDDFGSILQFVSTMLLYVDDPETLHPRIRELIPKCRSWSKTYKNSRVRTISNASSRMIMQIEGMDPTAKAQLKVMLASSLLCGYTGCGKRSDLTACAGCKVQRYCGKEHQKKDWKYHKHICNKGLEEAESLDQEAE